MKTLSSSVKTLGEDRAIAKAHSLERDAVNRTRGTGALAETRAVVGLSQTLKHPNDPRSVSARSAIARGMAERFSGAGAELATDFGRTMGIVRTAQPRDGGDEFSVDLIVGCRSAV